MYVILFGGRQKLSTNVTNGSAYYLKRSSNQKRIKGTVMQMKRIIAN